MQQAYHTLCFTYYSTMDSVKRTIFFRNTRRHHQNCSNNSNNSTFITVKTKHEFSGAFVKLQKKRLSSSSCPSVCPSAWNNSDSTGRIFITIGISGFFENLSRKTNFHWYNTNITGTLHEDRYTFLITSRSVLLRMRNVSKKVCW